VDLTEFLTDRYDEEQRTAACIAEWGPSVVDPYGYLNATIAEFITTHSPARVLADIAAKRGIVERYSRMVEGLAQAEHPLTPANRRPSYEVDMLTVNVTAYYQVVRVLAAPYAEHPDYNPAWTVS
jgi:Family of unknown function (DUF6221)